MFPHMKPIQILIDQPLVEAVDREARRQKTDRSKLVREALRTYLAHSKRRALEERHRQGYAAHPTPAGETTDWEKIAQWPKD